MKTLKLSIAGLLLMSSTMLMAINPNSALNKAAAQQELFSNFKTTLTENGVVEGMQSNSTELLVIYCHVNRNNEVVIDKLRSYNDEIKENVQEIMKANPIKASSTLIGETIAFKLRFEIK